MSEVFNGAMRAISSLLGLLMVLMGGVWILQGFNIAFLNSFMADDRQWAVWGLLLAVVGVAQIVWSNTRERYYKRRCPIHSISPHRRAGRLPRSHAAGRSRLPGPTSITSRSIWAMRSRARRRWSVSHPSRT